MALTIHLTAAVWALLAGISQLYALKGTRVHKIVGWSWMTTMVAAGIGTLAPGRLIHQWVFG